MHNDLKEDLKDLKGDFQEGIKENSDNIRTNTEDIKKVNDKVGKANVSLGILQERTRNFDELATKECVNDAVKPLATLQNLADTKTALNDKINRSTWTSVIILGTLITLVGGINALLSWSSRSSQSHASPPRTAFNMQIDQSHYG